MTLQRLLPFLLAVAALPSRADTPLLRSAREVRAAVADASGPEREFTFTGTLRGYYRGGADGWVCNVGDGTVGVELLGNTQSFAESDQPLALTDTVRVSGKTTSQNGKRQALHTRIERLRKGDPSKLPLLKPGEIYSAGNLNRLVRLRGIVRDAARDESDPNFIHLTIADAEGRAQVMIIQPTFLPAEFLHLIGSEVIAHGVCSDNTRGLRRHVGRLLSVSGLENIRVAAAPDAFDGAPALATLTQALPQAIAGAGFHKTEGTVLASWGGNTFLLKTDDGKVVRVRLQSGRLPACETRVEALGLPVTDYYHINLIHAAWRASDRPPLPADTPRSTTPQRLLVNDEGFPQLMIPHHGETIRLTGIVRYLPDPTDPEALLQIESEGRLVSVETSSVPALLDGLDLGCTVSIAGTCVMKADDWHIDSTDRPPSGFFLVPRRVDDLRILSRPSWWTPRRLLSLFAVGLVALFGTLGWNLMLNRRARQKGRELAEEQVARVSSELKVHERTRLAVELHDALSQTLTGVSMQIDTAAGLAEGQTPAVAKCLTLASRTIDACRTELRNTLWDLRSAALDEPNLESAIRKTLFQNLSGVTLSVTFPVARETFSDNTAHTVLKIIRELAANALRHGRATAVTIAGTVEAGTLVFSVTDNGCGFDPDRAPSIAQGHFGLQGIAERLARLDGEMSIDSSPGRGARVTITLPLPPEDA